MFNSLCGADCRCSSDRKRKTVKPHKGVEIYNSAKSIGNNTLLVSAYNIPSDYTNGVLFKGGDTQKTTP